MTDSHNPYDELRPPNLEATNANEPDSWFLRGDEPPQAGVVSHSQRRRNRFIASVAGLGIAGAGIVGGLVATSGEGHKPKHAVALEHKQTAPLTTGNIVIDNNFETAAAIDTCKTPVSYNDLVTTYDQSFAPVDLDGLKPSALQVKVNEAAVNLAQASKEAGLVPLPSNFKELQNDIDSGRPTLPIRDYTKALSGYIHKLGVDTLFDWGGGKKTGNRFIDSHLSQYVQPVSTETLSKSQFSRPLMVSIMARFASLPPSIFKDAGVTHIALGNVVDKHALAESLYNEGIITFDVTDVNGTDEAAFSANLSLIGSLPTHELEHQLNANICFEIVPKHLTDPAYSWYNDGFKYGAKAREDFLTKGRSGAYTTLEASRNGKVAFARGDSLINVDEDEATLVGENVLDTTKAVDLYVPQGNHTIINEKVTQDLARITKKDAKLGNYLLRVLQASRVLQSIYNHEYQATIEAKGNTTRLERLQKPYQAMGKPLTDLLGFNPTDFN